MRKDRIEERLADLERELKSLKSEHRQSTESIILELKQFQEIVLEEKVAEIRAELSKGYMGIALDGYLDEASAKLEGGLPDPCPRNMREKCTTTFRKRMESAAGKLKEVEGQGVDQAASDIARDDDAILGHLKDNAACSSCYRRYSNERENLAKIVGRLSSYKSSIASRTVDDYVRKLPDDLVIASIVDPLSHKARFRMLKSLSFGGMSYKELTEATGYDGGHLLYHLNKLIDAGLAQKNEAGGGYFITQKGIGVMDLVKMLYHG